MAIDSVTIHYSEHPQILHGPEFFQHKTTILINLPHLGYETSARLECYLLNDISCFIV